MKKILYVIFACLIISCSTQKTVVESNSIQHTFLLEDNDSFRFQLIDAIKTAYSERNFINSPVIAIDGIIFKYNKSKDTIVLPLKKKDITNIIYLNKESSPAIYGKKETNGAIIINTTN